LKSLGIYDDFAIVVSGDSVPKKKPDPLPLLHAAEVLGVAPEDALMIGDSVNDVEAALVARPLLPAHAQEPLLPSGDPTLKQLERPERPPPEYQSLAEAPVLPTFLEAIVGPISGHAPFTLAQSTRGSGARRNQRCPWALKLDLVCVAANKPFIPNYGNRYRNGETISTAFAESTVNQVVRAVGRQFFADAFGGKGFPLYILFLFEGKQGKRGQAGEKEQKREKGKRGLTPMADPNGTQLQCL
jgi:hypothetical protein